MPLTIERIRTNILSGWKRLGIIDENISAVYDYYIKETHCMICFEPYINTFNKCLDHNHDTGEIRYICCRNCNSNFLREKNPVYNKPRSDNSSGFLNIHYNEREAKWIYKKQINKKRIKKRFHTKEDAIHYRDNYY